jgi:hypothetical protein
MRDAAICRALARATVATLVVLLCGAATIRETRGGSSNEAPLRARIAIPDTTVECQFPAMLDGTVSAGAIVAWDWFEDYGRGRERHLGSGPMVNVVLPAGEHRITLQVTDDRGVTDTDEVMLTAVDTVAPDINVDLAPSLLWPPNHRLADIHATVQAGDACGSVRIALQSIDSDEPDDAPGPEDGATDDDIQGADGGAEDTLFQLRAERRAGGAGRTYEVTYTATDDSGNSRSYTATVIVPPEMYGTAEPMMLALYDDGRGTVVAWSPVPGARAYDVVRGRLGDLSVRDDDAVDLGRLDCLASGLVRADTEGFEDAATPPPGEAFFYLAQYWFDAGPSGYGTESAARQISIDSRGCSPYSPAAMSIARPTIRNTAHHGHRHHAHRCVRATREMAGRRSR